MNYSENLEYCFRILSGRVLEKQHEKFMHAFSRTFRVCECPFESQLYHCWILSKNPDRNPDGVFRNFVLTTEGCNCEPQSVGFGKNECHVWILRAVSKLRDFVVVADVWARPLFHSDIGIRPVERTWLLSSKTIFSVKRNLSLVRQSCRCQQVFDVCGQWRTSLLERSRFKAASANSLVTAGV